MGTGFRGTFVISWSQTELDSLRAAPLESLEVGTVWSWGGDAIRVDGPSELLRLERTGGETNIRKRAARMVRRLVGAALTETNDVANVEIDEPLLDGGFVVTNGSQSFTITVIEVEGSQPLLMFLDELPPKNTELWVVHHTLERIERQQPGEATGGVICFTPGTMISTPYGPKPVEQLGEGDKVLTKDSGAEEVLWAGRRRMTGARLFAMPKLRPIRIRAGALGVERPDQELIVSPEHRMLVKGDVARALFNTPEVLVSAKDLVNGSTISVDYALREVTYVHLLLPRHQVLWANGVETESFHPASTTLSTLTDSDRDRLLERLPHLAQDTHSYGDFARRNLSTSEAAILQHEAA